MLFRGGGGEMRHEPFEHPQQIDDEFSMCP